MRPSNPTAFLLAFLCLAGAAVGVAGPALADTGAKAGTKAGIKAGAETGAGDAAPAASPVLPTPLRLDYALYGHGFHVMDVEAELRLTADGYAISLHNHTTGFVGLLTHTDVTSSASGRFDGSQARPVSFSSSGTSRGAERAVRIAYPDGQPQVQLLRPIDPDRDPVAAADTLHGIDAIGALAGLVRTVAQTGRCDSRARIFDGLRLSTITTTTAGDEAVPSSSRSSFAGRALRCDFTSLQIGGFLHDSEEARVRRPQHGTAWLASPGPGAPSVPVRIVFENPRFGSATLYLTSAGRGG